MTEQESKLARDLLGALKRCRRGLDVLMPGIGGLAISADDIANLNKGFIEADRAIAAAERAGIKQEK